MKNCLAGILILIISIPANANTSDTTLHYNLPDTVKAIQFMAEMNIQSITGKKEVFAGIKTDVVSLSVEADRKGKEVVFEFPGSALVMATGLNVDTSEKGELEWDYDWAIHETYKLLLAVATDSAENFSLYSGYIWLPRENKWKLIGTCKITGQWNTLKDPAVFYTSNRKTAILPRIGEVWCQRNNGSWKNMNPGILVAPIINLFSHADSAQLHQSEIKRIIEATSGGNTDAAKNIEGVYYTILKEGTGRQVSVNDTVVAFYKGYLLANGLVFDQTRDKPATFPLRRLIKGWQLGLPVCKVGGKIKLVIPSGLGYSIRTRAAKIPPNSILVFEIEVVDAKPPL